MTVLNTETRSKKLYYRRASWQAKTKTSLEKMIIAAHEQFPSSGERTFARIGGEVQCSSSQVKDEHKGIYLHITSYKPGEEASILDNDKTKSECDTDIYAAPEGKEFLDGDLFAYIRNNHVLFCSSSLREAGLQYYLRKILAKYGKPEVGHTLTLASIADSNKLKVIRKEGVKAIDLNMSLYNASLLRLEETDKKSHGLMNKVYEEFSRVFAEDPENSEMTEMENVDVRVSLRFDGKNAHHKRKTPEFGATGKKHLKLAAEKIVHEYDPENEVGLGFEIITYGDTKISPHEIQISSHDKISKQGKSVTKVDAWQKLRTYYNDLKDKGILNQ
ncbi:MULTISPECIES: hypothetical protein [Pseudoalteromonas]|uniref:Uncharacterized protein n=1 Tax=Pseudoalteromonas piscicida TaxID=43662 RepID=A0AAD0W2U1_PSEO7|nr:MULTISPECIES: hypothetical protein [Pseudoalteromonas]ASD67701.1 hypothetical protein B1L02_12180 [Pseudoalteromonas piscicida]AXR01595.1 hypothetical protein D0511_05550 [Pseudoalteromonas piscicida]MCG9761636.1 hypothetical protein [Pseudoalteromonas sp. Isolate6]TMN39076.1 hypothetical protein CWC03_10305 [Pseudoalteromonas sp. S2755]